MNVTEPEPELDRTEAALTRGRGRLTARFLAVLATLLAVMAGALITSSSASADAKGCTVYSRASIAGYSVPSGTYCATIVGRSTTVNGVQGEFYAPNLCNWDVTAEFFDSSWNYRRTFTSAHQYGCNYGSGWASYIPVNATISQLTGTSSGYMCSTLRVGWQRVTSVCNYVY